MPYFEVWLGPIARPSVEQVQLAKRLSVNCGNCVELRRRLQAGDIGVAGTLEARDLPALQGELEAVQLPFRVEHSRIVKRVLPRRLGEADGGDI